LSSSRRPLGDAFVPGSDLLLTPVSADSLHPAALRLQGSGPRPSPAAVVYATPTAQARRQPSTAHQQAIFRCRGWRSGMGVNQGHRRRRWPRPPPSSEPPTGCPKAPRLLPGVQHRQNYGAALPNNVEGQIAFAGALRHHWRLVRQAKVRVKTKSTSSLAEITTSNATRAWRLPPKRAAWAAVTYLKDNFQAHPARLTAQSATGTAVR